MKKDKEGFLYPSVDSSLCVECGLCEKVCPVKYPFIEKLPENSFAAISKCENIRKNSSSGGVFSELSENVIQAGGVVFGAAFDEDYRVCHIPVSNICDLQQLRGSKYLQSDTGNTFALCKEYLKKGVPVLYSGTPCQISGLKHFLNKEYPNLLLVDVICHGVPSPDVWGRYLDSKRLRSAEKITSVSFRDKTNGWKRFSLSISHNGTISYISPQDIDTYMQLFLNNIILRPSCYQCPAKAGKSGSDITIADFWGIENVIPEMDDNKGTSLIMVNTKIGAKWFDKVDCLRKEVSFDSAIACNQNWRCSAKLSDRRKSFFSRYRWWIRFDQKAGLFLHADSGVLSKLKRLMFGALKKLHIF